MTDTAVLTTNVWEYARLFKGVSRFGDLPWQNLQIDVGARDAEAMLHIGAGHIEGDCGSNGNSQFARVIAPRAGLT